MENGAANTVSNGKRLAVIILAAGKGTRMQSRAVPKVLQELCGVPLLEYPVRVARSLKPGKIVAVVGFRKDLVMQQYAGGEILFAVQKRQAGTGDAAKAGLGPLSSFEGDVVILNADLPHLSPHSVKRFVEAHRESGAGATVLGCRKEDPSGYGRIVHAPDGYVSDIVEESDAGPEVRAVREVNAGLYVFESRRLRKALAEIRPDNAQKEYYLTDAVRIIARQGGRCGTFTLEDETEIEQVSTRADLARSAKRKFLESARYHMDLGVTIVSPENTFIDQDVTIGKDTVVFPFTVIRRGVRIGECCEVGPFAHLRKGTVLEEGAEVGNFTEAKNSTLGRGSKAKHLSYLGDGEVGEGVNIGAGTIFANYDGKEKHKTVIEKEAFIGSGSILVAPVRVGKGATTGAGAVVTKKKDVLPGEVVVGMPAGPLVRGRSGKKDKRSGHESRKER